MIVVAWAKLDPTVTYPNKGLLQVRITKTHTPKHRACACTIWAVQKNTALVSFIECHGDSPLGKREKQRLDFCMALGVLAECVSPQHFSGSIDDFMTIRQIKSLENWAERNVYWRRSHALHWLVKKIESSSRDCNRDFRGHTPPGIVLIGHHYPSC